MESTTRRGDDFRADDPMATLEPCAWIGLVGPLADFSDGNLSLGLIGAQVGAMEPGPTDVATSG